MLHRRDRNLLTEGEVTTSKRLHGEDLWRGLDLRPGSAFVIPDVRRFASFRGFPDTCGWMVEAPSEVAVRVSFLRNYTQEVVSERLYRGAFQSLRLPWPRSSGMPGQLDLRVEAVGAGKGAAFVANHRALSRQWLIDAAVGRGMEIGPGPQPQILPSDAVDVLYLEQVPPEAWNKLYNQGGKYVIRPELWNNYTIGTACSLPVADSSLDFIFASHVFEHLANPIGHLKHWFEKLAPGGSVICVVPDLSGTKDAVQERSTLDEWREEFETGLWTPGEKHYLRHLRLPIENRIVQRAMEREESIHVHFYDNLNCQLLLKYAVEQIGYADYIIEHTPNHKDFHFILMKW